MLFFFCQFSKDSGPIFGMDSFQALQIRDDFRESHLEFHGIRILFQPIHDCPADNRKNCDSEAERRSIKRVTPGQLEAWGIISKVRGKWIASNAYALLTGNPLFAIRLKCGVFKGDDKDVFLDRREFVGSVPELIDKGLE